MENEKSNPNSSPEKTNMIAILDGIDNFHPYM